MTFSPKKPGKSNPPIRLVTEMPPAPIRLSGLEPAAEMGPGRYLASCVEASLQRSKNRAALEFTIIDGEHAGTALSMWINGVNGAIHPKSRYARECALALGRDLTAEDNLDPAVVFKGKHFVVEVGFRLTDQPGGGKARGENAQCKKDSRDYLRVHRLVRVGEP
jgi:hypothetical protein